MADNIDNNIKKEWLTKALGSVNLSAEQKIDNNVLDEEAVILITGSNMFGDQIYSFVKVALRNFRKLRDVMMSGENFSPSDFGEVVAAGRGEPSQEVMDEMRVTYKMVDLPKPAPQGRAPQGFAQPKFFGEDD